MTAYRDRGALVEASQGCEVVEFRPERHQLIVAALDFGIKQARCIRDWPALEEAVDLKIGEQRKFYAWWQASVAHGGGSKNRDRGSYSLDRAEKLTGMKQQRVSDLGKWLNKPDDTYRRHLLGATYRAALLDDEHDHHDGDEWGTPVEIIEPVRAFYGGQIDCDPASKEVAQRIVRATVCFTKEQDGLKQPWPGKTFLNGPYSDLAPWVNKLISEYGARHVSEAVVLTNGAIGTAWFNDLLAAATAVCLVRDRIRFLDASGREAPNGPTIGQVLFYLGPRLAEFAEHFLPIGSIAIPYRSA
jgi:DNA N-6-adenine-methyltransferase (Dam)